MSIDWNSFKAIVEGAERFLLVSHIRPDCDALGSELGLAGVLDALGKQVTIVNGDPVPPNLTFIDPKRRIKTLGQDVEASEIPEVDVLVVLDTTAWAQLGPMADVIKATTTPKIVLDHHVSGDDLGAELFKDVRSPATGCIVLEAAEQLGVTVTPEIAAPLFAAVATDTGWFRFDATTGETFRVGGKLVDAGANPQAIFTELYEQDTLARLQLRGRILARTQTELDGRLAHTAVLQEDFQVTGAHPADTEDVINMTLCIAGVEAAVILVQRKTGEFKISFRSRGAVDCSELAAQFDGGGHKAAAGATVAGSLETARKRVLDAVRAAMQR